MTEVVEVKEAVSPDLSDYSTTETVARLDLVHPVSRQKLGVYLMMLSADNPNVKARQRRHFKEVLVAQREKREEELLDEVDASQLDTLVAATQGWGCTEGEGYFKFKGSQLRFTSENARRFFRETPAFADQAMKFIMDRKGFWKV